MVAVETGEKIEFSLELKRFCLSIQAAIQGTGYVDAVGRKRRPGIPVSAG